MNGPPKIYMRGLLYATSKRGQVVESLWLTLSRGELVQTFAGWVYGDDALCRGAGVFVGESGLVTGHHFLLSPGEHFDFKEGHYELRIYGLIVGHRTAKVLLHQRLDVSSQSAAQLYAGNAGLYFNYSPITSSYTQVIHSPVQDWINSMRPINTAADNATAFPAKI